MAGRREEFVPLPRPVPQDESDDERRRRHRPQGRRPRVHYGDRNPLDGRRSPSPDMVVAERIIERERDRRRQADAIAREEHHRRREAEAAADREHAEVRRLAEITNRLANAHFHEGRRRTAAEEAAYHARRAAERAEQEAEIAERERMVAERQRNHEREMRARAEAAARARPLPYIHQAPYPLRIDRGAEVIRQAQAEELRRQEDELIYGLGRPHRDGRPEFIYEWERRGRNPYRR